MEKKLPSVYANKIDGKVSNNKRVAYSKNGELEHEVSLQSTSQERKFSFEPEKNINQKLNSIFNSPKYVYKADVTIVTKDETIQRKIIGQNSTHLITLENELIPISEIIDISFTQ